jgi:hypothetical protein
MGIERGKTRKKFQAIDIKLIANSYPVFDLHLSFQSEVLKETFRECGKGHGWGRSE